MVKFLFHVRGIFFISFFFLQTRDLKEIKGNLHISLYPSRGFTHKNIATNCHRGRCFISRKTGGRVSVLFGGFFVCLVLGVLFCFGVSSLFSFGFFCGFFFFWLVGWFGVFFCCFGFFCLILIADDVSIIAVTHWYTIKTKTRLHKPT